MTFWLEMHDGENRRLFELSQAEFTIGRGPDNDAILGDRRSSRRHCRLQVTPQGLLLEDLESRNGTVLNGYAVKKSFVKAGDEFLIGNARFWVREGEGDPPRLESTAKVEPSQGPPESERSHAPAQDVTAGGRAEAPAAPAAQQVAAGGEDILDEPEDVLEPAVVAAGESPARPRETTEARLTLEGLQGPHAGERVLVENTPFVLGRGKDCDFCIHDQRASGKHARILYDGAVYSLEDLGSTNGTLLNKRPVKQATLTSGAVLQIGNASFRIQAPMQAAGSVEVPAAAEEFVQFDAEKFLARGGSEHPATMAIAVAIIAILGYFAIDITQRIVKRPEVDPHLEGNMLGEHWSFEAAPGTGAAEDAGATVAGGSVPGWRLRSWSPEGEAAASEVGGSMEITQKGAQPPGRQALRLLADAGDVASLASRDVAVGIQGGELYRLEGHAVNEGCFAASLAVEWLRETGGEPVLMERHWSEAARSDGGALDVDLILRAPPGATRAVVSCVVLGAGAAVFDRIALERHAADDETESPAESESAPEPVVARSEFRLAGGPDTGSLLHLVAKQDGTLSVERSRKQRLVPALWVGLGPERDSYSVGPRLAANRVMTRDRDSVLQVGEVPDQVGKEWLTLEAKVTSKRGDVSVRWRTSGDAGAGEAGGLALHVEIVDGLVPVELHGDADAGGNAAAPAGEDRGGIRELVIGERGERVSLLFASPLRFTRERHPVNVSRVLLVGRTDQPSLELSMTRGSRFEAVAAREHFRKAEGDFRAGRVAEAVTSLSRLEELYPAQEAEIGRARERIAEWRKLMAEALGKVTAELRELQRVPNPVVHELLTRRTRELAERYRGTGPGEEAARLLDSMNRFWEERDEQRAAEELKRLYELGRRHFASNELAQATLYLRWVAAGDPAGQMGREASSTLKLIEERRKTNQELFLR